MYGGELLGECALITASEVDANGRGDGQVCTRQVVTLVILVTLFDPKHVRGRAHVRARGFLSGRKTVTRVT
jgi:hypothetical protein